jgi:phosphate starvation-inducible protein PhoH
MKRGQKAVNVELQNENDEAVASYIFRQHSDQLVRMMQRTFEVNFVTSMIKDNEKPIGVIHFHASINRAHVKKDNLEKFFTNMAHELNRGEKLNTTLVQRIANVSAKGMIFNDMAQAQDTGANGAAETPVQGTPKPKTPRTEIISLDKANHEVQRVAHALFVTPKIGGKTVGQKLERALHVKFALRNTDTENTSSPIEQIVIASNAERFVVPVKDLVNEMMDRGLRLSSLGLSELLTATNLQPFIHKARVAAGSEPPVVLRKEFVRPAAPKAQRSEYVLGKTEEQEAAIELLDSPETAVGFIKGKPGSGKSHLTMGIAAKRQVEEGKTIVLSRSVTPAEGEDLGFLPGGVAEKINPFLRPLYTILEKILRKPKNLSVDLIEDMLQKRQMIIAPLAYIRGTTLDDSTVVFDEAQNARRKHVGDVITRLGHGSKLFMTYDAAQSDLPREDQGGVEFWAKRMGGQKGVALITLSENSIQRHPLVKVASSIMDEIHEEEERAEAARAQRSKISEQQVVHLLTLTFRNMAERGDLKGIMQQYQAANDPSGEKALLTVNGPR